MKIHPFESAGLGLAPFHVTGWERKVGPIPLGDGMTTIGSPGQPMGSCDYCGQGIAICVSVQSRDGKRFVVGCDCADKCFPDDKIALNEVDRIRATIAKEQRDKRNQERRDRDRAFRAKREQAERDANGGKTIREIEAEQIAQLVEAKRQQVRVNNGWLLAALRDVPYESDFIRGMIDMLQSSPLSDLSLRCQNILCDIYAKQAGRRGSKKYDAAVDEFHANQSPQNSEIPK